MNKKTIKVVAILLACVALCVLAILLVWYLTDCGTVRIDGQSIALSSEEMVHFRKSMKRDAKASSTGGFGFYTSYGCGFSEDFSIRMGGLAYCFGKDSCPSIYVVELDYYYSTSNENHEEIHRLLTEISKGAEK